MLDIVRAFVGQEVTDEMPSASRNHASPNLGVLFERFALKRVDLVANKARKNRRYRRISKR